MSSANASAAGKRHSAQPTATNKSRAAAAAAAPRPPVAFSTALTISENAVLTGSHQIAVADEAVIHPWARIDSTTGPVSVGRCCILRERCVVGAVPTAAAAGASLSDRGSGNGGVVLGNYSIVEVNAVVEAGRTEIGEGTAVGVGARVGAGARVGRYCSITAKSVVAPGEHIPDFTVVYANGQTRPDARGVAEHTCRAQVRQIEILRRLIVSRPEKFM